MAKPKMTLPPVNLDLTLEAGKMKAITAAATGKSTEYVVNVDQLRTIPGFNVRVTETEDYRSDLEALKQSIRENGFYPNKPLAGYIGKDGDEDVIYVTDGHRRLQAVNEINDEALNDGEAIEGLPVVLKPATSTMADLTIALVQDNAGRPLTPYEMAVVVQRLAGMVGDDDKPLFTKAEIAAKLSVTERYIDDLNVLYAASAKVRNAVLEGSVSSTLAIQELRKNPKKAEERLLAAVDKARASGRSKATRKHVEGSLRMQKVRLTVSMATGTPMGEVLKALAAQIRNTVPHAGKEDGDGLLVDGTLTVTAEIPAPEAAPKAAKAKSGKSSGRAAKAATTPAAAKSDASDQSSTSGAAKKPAAKKSAAKPKKSAPAEEPEVTSEEEGEPVKALPPAVPTVDGSDDPDDI